MSDHASPTGPDRTGDRGETAAEDAHPPLWKNRNFRRFFLGQFVTNAGDSLYSVAILWLVFELSGSTFLTGVASSMLLLPFLLQVVAGPMVDRFRVKPILVGTQLVQGVVVLVVPLTAYAGTVTVPLLLVTIPALALMGLLMSPMSATVVPRIVPEEQLSRSNSALATVSLGLDMVFDALGGLFVALFGATALFLVDSATFALAGLLFFGMSIPTVDGGGESTGGSPVGEYLADLRAGVDVLRGTVFVEMLFTAAVSNFAVGVTLAVLPAYGDLVGGPAIYGLLLGGLGVGRLVGSASASALESVPFGWLTVVTYLAATILWLGSLASGAVVLTVSLFGLAWVASGIDGVLTQTLNQRVFPADLLGRVSATKGTASTATLPLGSLIGGLAAEFLGTTTTMALAGLGFGFVGVYFALRPRLRRLPPVEDADPADFDVRVEDPPAAASSEGE